MRSTERILRKRFLDGKNDKSMEEKGDSCSLFLFYKNTIDILIIR